MKCKLFQTKKDKGIVGDLSVSTGRPDRFNSAEFYINDKLIAKLKNPQVVDITGFIVKLNGFERNGLDKSGVEKFLYREWICNFSEFIK
jgi:hypothetical protein